jgi:hypothetical protein
MNQYRYEVIAELYWDGTQLRKQGDIITITAAEPLKIAAAGSGGTGYKPSLKQLKDEDEHPTHRKSKPKADD